LNTPCLKVVKQLSLKARLRATARKVLVKFIEFTPRMTKT